MMTQLLRDSAREAEDSAKARLSDLTIGGNLEQTVEQYRLQVSVSISFFFSKAHTYIRFSFGWLELNRI